MDIINKGNIIDLGNIEDDDSLKEFPKENGTKIILEWNKKEGIEEIDYPKFYKKERLQENITVEEQTLLDAKVRLDDGTLGEVVTCYKRGKDWIYYCHLCLQEDQGWRNFEEHVNSIKHQMKLSKSAHSRNKFITKHTNDDLTSENIEIDPVPCNIQPHLDKYEKPLVGLEYLVESNVGFEGLEATPQYYCLLCDEPGNVDAIKSHLSSMKHYLKYFFMFFPTALEKLKQFATAHANIPDLLTAVIEHVAARIETEYGRLKPLQLEHDNFQQLKFIILSKIDRGKHIRETKDTTFEECVCLTHLHLSVCRVVSYQEKWIAVEKNKMNKLEQPINSIKMNEFAETKNISPFTNQNGFASSSASGYTRIVADKKHIKNSNSRFDSSKFSVKNQQQKFGKLHRGNKSQLKQAASCIIDLSKDSSNNRYQDRKRNTPLYGQDNIKKRMKFGQGNIGVSHTNSQTSRKQMVNKVLATPKYGSFNTQLLGTVPLLPILNPVSSNFNPVINNHSNFNPVTNNNIKVPIINTVTKPPSFLNNTSVTPIITQHTSFQQSNRNLAGDSRKVGKLPNTKKNINTKYTMYQRKSQTQTLNTNQPTSIIHYKHQNFQINTIKNQHGINTNNTSIASSSKIITNQFSQIKPNFQGTITNYQKTLNLNVQSQLNTFQFTQEFPKASVSTTFNSTQSINTMSSQFVNNTCNIKQLNPVAFRIPPPILNMPPPQLMSQIFNKQTLNQFDQQLRNLRKY